MHSKCFVGVVMAIAFQKSFRSLGWPKKVSPPQKIENSKISKSGFGKRVIRDFRIGSAGLTGSRVTRTGAGFNELSVEPKPLGPRSVSTVEKSSSRISAMHIFSTINCATRSPTLITTSSIPRLASRSGLALRNGIEVGAGVIDTDYRGEIGVLLFNRGMEEVVINVGDRVAQLIVEKYA